ncbi:MAG TPA: signal peptidase I [Planctomycetota bacterium]|nr:signal peptidase I [Planctomycetota bacterium]
MQIRKALGKWYFRVPLEVGLLLFIWFFVIQYRPTRGASMLPTLPEGSYVFVDKLSLWFGEPVRGEVIIFQSNEEPREQLCKRVVGLPGETLEISGGKVFINSSPLYEPYIIGNTFWERPPVKIGHDQYYVIGDNRGMRITGHWQGLVARRNILGRVIGKGYDHLGDTQ